MQEFYLHNGSHGKVFHSFFNCCSVTFLPSPSYKFVLFYLQRGYRVKLDEQKFIVPTDRVDLVCAKNAADVLNEVSFTPSHCDIFCPCVQFLLYENRMANKCLFCFTNKSIFHPLLRPSIVKLGTRTRPITHCRRLQFLPQPER